ncbi:MAG: hypothetical protein JWM44_4180 [Bacilli bacterium]|nr:hypothetical protein [Bacilli bacterium]
MKVLNRGETLKSLLLAFKNKKRGVLLVLSYLVISIGIILFVLALLTSKSSLGFVFLSGFFTILLFPLSIVFSYLIMMEKRPFLSEERIMALIFFLYFTGFCYLVYYKPDHDLKQVIPNNQMVLDLINTERIGTFCSKELDPKEINLEHAAEFNPATKHLDLNIFLNPEEFISDKEYEDPDRFAKCIRLFRYLPNDELYHESRAAKTVTLTAYWGKEIIYKENYSRKSNGYNFEYKIQTNDPKLIVKDNKWWIRSTIDNTTRDIFVKDAMGSIDYEY